MTSRGARLRRRPMPGLMSTATPLPARASSRTPWRRPGSGRTARPNRPAGRFAKDQFDINLTDDTVTCPAGQTTPIRRGKDGDGTAHFGSACTDCPVRAQCTRAREGRTIGVGVFEQRLTDARTGQKNPTWGGDYRATRPKVERKIGHLMRRKHGGRRARVRGAGAGPAPSRVGCGGGAGDAGPRRRADQLPAGTGQPGGASSSPGRHRDHSAGRGAFGLPWCTERAIAGASRLRRASRAAQRLESRRPRCGPSGRPIASCCGCTGRSAGTFRSGRTRPAGAAGSSTGSRPTRSRSSLTSGAGCGAT